MARTRWMLGFQRRLVRRCEWLMLMPNDGRLPHTSQTAAIGNHSPRHLGPPGVPGPAVGPTDQVSIPRMQTLERLTASDLAAGVTAYRDALRAHQERINRLNVYPVPDGDTGTNMALTLEAVVRQLAEADSHDMASVAQAVSYGSLMGARGNSGVILSQILRGLADAVRDTDGIDASGAERKGWPGPRRAPTRPCRTRSRAPSSPWPRLPPTPPAPPGLLAPGWSRSSKRPAEAGTTPWRAPRICCRS